MRDAAAIVRSRLRQTQGRPAVISRGQDSCNVTVTLGLSDLVATAKNEFRIQGDAQDIFVQRNAYAPTGAISDPANMDQIVVTMLDGSLATFEVRHPAQGQQCFQTTTHGTELRVHCRKVNSVPTIV